MSSPIAAAQNGAGQDRNHTAPEVKASTLNLEEIGLLEPPCHCCAAAIVGGGCSGLLVAVQLLRHGFQGRIIVIEPRERLGAGLAYSTPFPQHLLNVPAGKMSALPQQPSHYLDWLRARLWPDAGADSFTPRRLYGEYLHELLQDEVRASPVGRFSHIRAEAIAVDASPKGARLTLSDGSAVHAERVVLAVGNPASSSLLAGSRHGLEDCWHSSPWSDDALQVRFAGEKIMILGTGLTAVDAVLALRGQRLACEIKMVSRRGILPAVHNLRLPTATPPVFRERGNLRALVRELRDQIETSRDEGLCWRTTIDALRLVSDDLWRELPLADRQRFGRHLKSYWEPHRHRMAPEIRARLDQCRADGTVQVVAGRLASVSSGQDGGHTATPGDPGIEQFAVLFEKNLACVVNWGDA